MARAYKTNERIAIGALIRAMREERGLTQSDLSDLAGLVSGTIHRLETGSDVRTRTMKLILEALGKQSKISRTDLATIAEAYKINPNAIDPRVVQQSDEPVEIDTVHAHDLHLLLDRVIAYASGEAAQVGIPVLSALERFMLAMVENQSPRVLMKRHPPEQVGTHEVEVVEPATPKAPRKKSG